MTPCGRRPRRLLHNVGAPSGRVLTDGEFGIVYMTATRCGYGFVWSVPGITLLDALGEGHPRSSSTTAGNGSLLEYGAYFPSGQVYSRDIPCSRPGWMCGFDQMYLDFFFLIFPDVSSSPKLMLPDDPMFQQISHDSLPSRVTMF